MKMYNQVENNKFLQFICQFVLLFENKKKIKLSKQIIEKKKNQINKSKRKRKKEKIIDKSKKKKKKHLLKQINQT